MRRMQHSWSGRADTQQAIRPTLKTQAMPSEVQKACVGCLLSVAKASRRRRIANCLYAQTAIFVPAVRSDCIPFTLGGSLTIRRHQ